MRRFVLVILSLEIADIVCLILLLSFPALDFISGQLNSLINPIHRISGQFVNKPGLRLFCDRALLISNKSHSNS